MKIALNSVFVHNPIEAFEFYTEVPGLIRKMYMPRANLAIVASPDDPGWNGFIAGTKMLTP